MTLWTLFSLVALASPPSGQGAMDAGASLLADQTSPLVGAEISAPRPELIITPPGAETELKAGAFRHLPVGFRSAASRNADETPETPPNYVDGMNERRLRCDFHPRDLHETRPAHRPVMACGADETEREMVFERARMELEK